MSPVLWGSLGLILMLNRGVEGLRPLVRVVGDGEMIRGFLQNNSWQNKMEAVRLGSLGGNVILEEIVKRPSWGQAGQPSWVSLSLCN